MTSRLSCSIVAESPPRPGVLRKLRIGLAITSLHGGGAEFVVRTWAASLVSLGHDVVVYTYVDDDVDVSLAAGVTHKHISTRSRGDRFTRLPLWLRHRLRRDDLDVLVTMLTFTNLVGIVTTRSMRRRHRPLLLVSERSVATTHLPLEGRGGRAQRIAARWLYRASDGAIAISHPVAGDLVGGYRLPPDRVFVVPNPVAPATRNGPLRGSSGSNTILFVGRVTEHKNPLVFVRALDVLRREHGLPVVGKVIGDGPLLPAMKQEAARLAVPMEWAGWVQPWTGAVSGARCLLLTSSAEGFGNVLVEAAAAGIPSVASSTALGVGDAIVPGLTGEFALGPNPREFAAAVASVRPTDPAVTAAWLDRFDATASAEKLLAACGLAAASATPGMRRRRAANKIPSRWTP
jgi:glycosyltransferase involved in cell wall biosynthesis